MPSSGNSFRGGSSTDDWDETGNSLMEWGFQPNGAAGFTHAAVEINTDGDPNNDPMFVFDFGDAPDITAGTAIGDYQTLLANKGPMHAPKGAMLGDYRDAEADGKQSAAATGDDIDIGTPAQLPPFAIAKDDEDGVSKFATNGVAFAGGFVSQWMGTNTGSVDIEVNLETDAKTLLEIPAYVTGYIDWNRDGDFDDKGELVIAGAQVLKSGTDTYSFNIPMSADVVEGKSIMRVRLSHATMGDAKILASGGHASSGEVEDYSVGLVHGAEIHGIKFEDIDGDGVRDLNEPPLPGVLISLQGPGGLGTTTKTIDFDAKSFAGNPGVGFSFAEDGYTIAAVADHNEIDNTVGNLPSAIDTTSFSQVANPITFTRVDGGDFYFEKFDLASASTVPPDQSEQVQFTGLLNGKVVYTFTKDSLSTAFSTETNAFASTPIDELRVIDIHNGLEDGAIVDNIIFSHVANLLGQAVQSVVTDKDGKFWFVNLDAGDYTVVEHVTKSDTNGDGVFDAGDIVGGHFVDQGLTPSTPTSVTVTLRTANASTASRSATTSPARSTA